MRLAKTKNASRNLKWGLVYRFSGLLIPFICKAGIIRIFGINYLGLSHLFASILNALNLAELGFGTTVVYFMYGAIANEDNERLRALLAYFRRVYKIIGIVILAAGIALTPFLPLLIKKDIPSDINIYVLYLMSLCATSLSYLLFGYKNSILTAYQRSSVLYAIYSLILVVESIYQIIAIFIIKNYYVYLASGILSSAAKNLLIYFYTKKHYPNLFPCGDITQDEKKEINNKVRGLFYYSLGSVIVNSADSIIISSFLGLNISGIYGNYYYVITLLYGLLAVYYTSFRAGLGNSVVTDSVEKNYEQFKQLQFMQYWIIGWCTTCLLCMYQDFIYLYAGKDNLLPYGIVICLSALFYCWKIQDVVYVYKEASGLWTSDKFRPIIGALINFTLNIISVQYIGLYGVVLSTVIISATLDLVWMPRALFKTYFKKSLWEYYRLLLIGLINFACMFIPTYMIADLVHVSSHFARLILVGIICISVPNILFVIINHRKKQFHVILRIASRKLR